MSYKKPSKRSFNPFVLQLPEPKGPLKIDLYIESLGYVVSRLLQEPLLERKFSRDELHSCFQEYLSARGVKAETQDFRFRSTNDLRRLDIIRVVGEFNADYLGYWHPNKPAIPGRSLLAVRSIKHLLSPFIQDYFKLGALALVVSILIGETPCINATRLILLSMRNQAYKYIEKIVYERNLSDADVRDIINDIEIKNKHVFTRALSIIKETNLFGLLSRIYGINLGLLRLLLTHH